MRFVRPMNIWPSAWPEHTPAEPTKREPQPPPPADVRADGTKQCKGCHARLAAAAFPWCRWCDDGKHHGEGGRLGDATATWEWYVDDLQRQDGRADWTTI